MKRVTTRHFDNFNADCPKSPWWVWPHSLGLDAAAVAAGGYGLLAGATGSPVRPERGLLFAVCVWLVYLADRWIDAGRIVHGPLRSPFHRRRLFMIHRRRWAIGWMAVWGTTVFVAHGLMPVAVLVGGWGVAVLALAYMALRPQLKGFPWLRAGLIGLLFGLGACVFATGQPTAVSIAPTLAFAGVCTLDCRLIHRLEARPVSPRRIEAWRSAVDGALALGLLLLCTALYGP